MCFAWLLVFDNAVGWLYLKPMSFAAGSGLARRQRHTPVLGGLNIGGGDAAVGAATANVGEVDAHVLGQLLGVGRGNDTPVSALCWRGRRWGVAVGGLHMTSCFDVKTQGMR